MTKGYFEQTKNGIEFIPSKKGNWSILTDTYRIAIGDNVIEEHYVGGMCNHISTDGVFCSVMIRRLFISYDVNNYVARFYSESNDIDKIYEQVILGQKYFNNAKILFDSDKSCSFLARYKEGNELDLIANTPNHLGITQNITPLGKGIKLNNYHIYRYRDDVQKEILVSNIFGVDLNYKDWSYTLCEILVEELLNTQKGTRADDCKEKVSSQIFKLLHGYTINEAKTILNEVSELYLETKIKSIK